MYYPVFSFHPNPPVPLLITTAGWTAYAASKMGRYLLRLLLRLRDDLCVPFNVLFVPLVLENRFNPQCSFLMF